MRERTAATGASDAERAVMRGIVEREHKRALAERREARAAHEAEGGAAPASTAVWVPPPAPRPKPVPATRSARTAEWARRHPELAADERRLRKGQADAQAKWKHKREGTPETHDRASRRHQGALAKLYQSGAIDAEQLASAVEISTVAERIRSDVTVRTMSLETRVDVARGGDAGWVERIGQVRREVAYTRWRSEVTGPVGAVLEMIVGDTVGFTVVARRYRMGHRRAKRLLIKALDLWPEILRRVCREVDDATLAAAHAGLMGG